MVETGSPEAPAAPEEVEGESWTWDISTEVVGGCTRGWMQPLQRPLAPSSAVRCSVAALRVRTGSFVFLLQECFQDGSGSS